MAADQLVTAADPKPGATNTLAYAKWRSALDAGFQVVPNVLVRAQAKLGLDALDLAVLLNITMHWWRSDELPYPQPKVIANRVGVSTRTIERRLEQLEERGFIARLAAEKSADKIVRRRIDLSGLIAKLEAAAAANLQARHQAEDFGPTGGQGG